LGIAIGLLVGLVAASAATGSAVWGVLTPGQIVSSSLIAVAVGVLTMGVRLIRLARASSRQHVVQQRRLLERRWAPAWLRARLDIVAIAVGLAILVLFVRSGGLKQTPIEGQTVVLSFYLLLAPIALWLGCTLLIFRGMLALFLNRSQPDRARPLRSWNQAARVWLARRPARTAVAMVLAALAVAFGTQVVTFVATYQAAKQADAQAAFGSDLRLTPAVADSLITLPPLGPDVVGASSFHLIPAQAGTDRKTILGIDAGSFSQATTRTPTMLSGQGIAALASDPSGILVAKEIAQDFSVRPGDTLTLTTFPDDLDKSRNYSFHVLGVYRSFPPTLPITEMVVSSTSAAFPPGYLPPPDFYLAKVAPGKSPSDVAATLRGGMVGKDFSVATISGIFQSNQRTLASLNLSGLSRLEAMAAGLVAAVGIAVLGAFLVLERRREFAILRTLGANTRQILIGPGMEGAIAVVGSLVIGIPVGLGLSVLAVRVLALFFTLPPPIVRVPFGALIGLTVFVAAASAVALAVALLAVTRVQAASVLREQ
jgi:putative ABC transport system permease protein